MSWSTLNAAASGLRFLYFKTLKWELERMDIPPRKTPHGCRRSSAARKSTGCCPPWATSNTAALMIIYAAGLRLSEATHLRVDDIDSSRMAICVKQGKGRKDRYTVLSPNLRDQLRLYWKRYPSREYLFLEPAPTNRSMTRRFRKPTPSQSKKRLSEKAAVRTPCVIVLQRICLRLASTSAPFRCSSDIRIYRLPHAT